MTTTLTSRPSTTTHLVRIAMATIALTLLAPLGAAAQEAEVSANAGWVSQYFYRGIFQKNSSASAGLDVGFGALSLGTWLADVEDGIEVDLYGSVGVDVGGGSLSVGGIAYLYTGEFDDTYLEVNLGAGYGPLSVEFSIGQYDGFGDPADYWFAAVTAEHEGFYGTVAGFGADFTGNYGEVGYGFSAAELDWTISGDPERFRSFWHGRRRRGPDVRAYPGVRCKQDIRTQLTDIGHLCPPPVTNWASGCIGVSGQVLLVGVLRWHPVPDVPRRSQGDKRHGRGR